MLRRSLLVLLCSASSACSGASTSAPPPGNDAAPSEVGGDDAGAGDAGDAGGGPTATIASSWLPAIDPTLEQTFAIFADAAFTKDGGVLVVGRFKGTRDFGKGPLTAPDAEDDGYIAKFSYPSLALQWVRNTNLAGEDVWSAITVLPSGDAIVTGSSTATGGNISLRVARISAATGSDVWTKTIDPTTTTGVLSPNAVAVLDASSVVLSGTIVGAATVDAVTLTSSGYSDIFALALADDGTAKWGYVDGVASADYRCFVTTDSASGDVVLSGMQGSPDRRLYVARVSAADGTKKWSKTIGSPGQAEGNRAVSDGASFYVAGDVESTVRFDDDTQTTTRGRVVASFAAADGKVPWATTRPANAGSSQKAYRDVALHNGKIIACGARECIWLTPSTGAVERTWTPTGFPSESSFGRVLVDAEGRLLIGGAGYGTFTINGVKSEARSFAFRPFLLVVQP